MAEIIFRKTLTDKQCKTLKAVAKRSDTPMDEYL